MCVVRAILHPTLPKAKHLRAQRRGRVGPHLVFCTVIFIANADVRAIGWILFVAPSQCQIRVRSSNLAVVHENPPSTPSHPRANDVFQVSTSAEQASNEQGVTKESLSSCRRSCRLEGRPNVTCRRKFCTIWPRVSQIMHWNLPLFEGGGTLQATERQVVDGLRTEVCGQQKQSNHPHNNQHNLNMPTAGRR